MSDAKIRLNKYLARAGLTSRRGADNLIRAGDVKCNGKTVTELGVMVVPGSDEISVNGRSVGEFQDKVTIVLNKPADVMTTMRDPQGRETVADLVKEESFRLVPVGRLDFPTEGVLVMTTDGELANRMLHPRYKVPKSYNVKLGGRPTKEALDRLRNGISLEDGRTKPALVEVLESEPRRTWIEIILTEGKKRQVRRMCEAIGHRPLRVVRTAFSTINVGNLRPGQYRYLTGDELLGIYKLVGMTRSIPPTNEYALSTGGRPLGRARRRKGVLPGEVRKPKRGEAPGRKKPKRKVVSGKVQTERPDFKSKRNPRKKPVVEVSKIVRPGGSKAMKPSDYRKKSGR